MKCPRDDSKLITIEDSSEGYMALRCPTCSGAWFPPRFFRALKYVKKFPADPTYEQITSGESSVADADCPQGCGKLKTTKFNDVDVDYCGNCNGIWLDLWETETLLNQRKKERLNKLLFIRDQIRLIPGIETKPAGGKSYFRSKIGHALSLGFKEKEVFLFGLLQWATIGVAYLLWVQMLDWIPEEVWRSAAETDGTSPADVVLWLWSFVCVGIAAFPVGLLSGCMGTTHFLSRSGKESTVATCLQTVVPHSWTLWIFHWIDGWITVNRILQRLPRKNDRRTAADRAREEALYYAWKVGISGVIPGILTGNNLVEAGKNSVVFVKDNFIEVAKLRAGYSALCWIVGIAAYLGSLVLFAIVDIVPDGDEVYGHIYSFYLWATGPIMVALAFVLLLLRPIYLLTLCEMYSEWIAASGREVTLPDRPSTGASAFATFMLLCLAVAIAYAFRDELGITHLLSIPFR